MKESNLDLVYGEGWNETCADSWYQQAFTPCQRPHLPEGRGEVFFLDIPFHRMSAMAIGTKPLARRTLSRVRGAAVVVAICPFSCEAVRRRRIRSD